MLISGRHVREISALANSACLARWASSEFLRSETKAPYFVRMVVALPIAETGNCPWSSSRYHRSRRRLPAPRGDSDRVPISETHWGWCAIHIFAE